MSMKRCASRESIKASELSNKSREIEMMASIKPLWAFNSRQKSVKWSVRLDTTCANPLVEQMIHLIMHTLSNTLVELVSWLKLIV